MRRILGCGLRSWFELRQAHTRQRSRASLSAFRRARRPTLSPVCSPNVSAPILGETVIVENKPGQGGSLALASLRSRHPTAAPWCWRRSPRWSSTRICTNRSATTSSGISRRALVADLPLLLVVNPSLPVKTVPELIAYAKANPDKLCESVVGQRHAVASRHGTVQAACRHHHPARALSRQPAGDGRPDGRHRPGRDRHGRPSPSRSSATARCA